MAVGKAPAQCRRAVVWATLVSTRDCAAGSGGAGGESSASASSRCGPAVDSQRAHPPTTGDSLGSGPFEGVGGAHAHLLYEPGDLVMQGLIPRGGLLQDADRAVA